MNNIIEVKNPATGEVVAKIVDASVADVDKAVKSARKGFEVWRKVSAQERAKVLYKASAIIKERAEDIAKSMTLEMGKPIKAARSEVLRAADLVTYFAEEGLRIIGDVMQANLANEEVMVIKAPTGVVGAITPANFPVSLLINKVGAALAAGCSVVAKPDEHATSCSLMIAKAFLDAGLPEGVFNMITGSGAGAGNALVNHEDVNVISFTGSLEAGRKIASEAAKTCKRVAMELGGQSPAIVMDKVDVAAMITAFTHQTFNNSGQYCYRINRAYVHEGVYDEFMNQLVAEVSKYKIGEGMDEACNFGPLTHEGILKRTMSHIEDALNKGATVKMGGKNLKGLFVEPTILENCNHDMLCMQEETFGPVLAVKKVSSLKEAVKLANDTKYGLAAFVFVEDAGTGLQVSRQIDAGVVWVNKIHGAYNYAPFGGMKQSGIGREKSKYGLDEFMELKTVYLTLPEV
ncbi:MAG: NAD-dependent succinate-semialdehyde dehydrogenase, partial [Lactobacillus sp.]|nr:NAD-dependent succinate-semialdehyde dehydrogenase [Lactobacillus sp.]